MAGKMKTVLLCAPENIIEKDAALVDGLKKAAKDVLVEVRFAAHHQRAQCASW
jgi:hypothetical protein